MGKRRNPHGMTRKQMYALCVLEEGPRRGYNAGVLTAGATCLLDGQPWINWRTAAALERRGFVRVIGEGEEAEVVEC